MIEKWKDTAFGSDFGNDFLELIESISEKELSFDLVYKNADLKKYLDNPDLLNEKTDNNVAFINSKFNQYIHFEDAIIAFSAIIVGTGKTSQVDLTKAYGNKVLDFRYTKKEIEPVFKALKQIHKTPDNYVLFEMCLGEEREETLNDIKDIIIEFEKLL